MSTATAKVRIRPIRFAFAVDPHDRDSLREVFRVNTILWGGRYNFIVPVFKRTPARYRDRYVRRGPSADQIMNGLVDAFQPDFIVETRPGLADEIRFERRRIISIDQLAGRDDRGRCNYGIDIRSICAALYDDSFKFVQRHPPSIFIPHSSDQRFDLLFAAAFGEFPQSGVLADCAKHYKGALDGKDKKIAPSDFPELFGRQILYPLRIGAHELTTNRPGWNPDPMLFYMDESSTYDLIEFWNYRAIGWYIRPLPYTLVEKLRGYCEEFIADVYKPYPPPSNAFRHAAFLCSPSCEMDRLKSFATSLKYPSNNAITLDWRVPRIWEEWGRDADHADPQIVSDETKSVDVTIGAGSLHLRTAIPDFIGMDHYAAIESACANVVESIPGGADVIPWDSLKLNALAGRFEDERIWLGREGIVTAAGETSMYRFLRAPTALNVFSAFAEASSSKLSLSPPGQICEHIVSALGGLQWVRLIADEGILKLFDRLARGDFELEVTDEPNKKRRLRMDSVPYGHVREVLTRATEGHADRATRRLSALVRCNALKLGIRLKCTECSQSSWYSLEELSSRLKCPRCMRQFELVVDTPPRDAEWAYRVLGPFAVENFAFGAYTVAMAVQFIAEEVAQASTWIPSFTMSGSFECEADFGMFVRSPFLSHIKGPFLIFGECKSFGDFEDRDFRRARNLAELFPGAILCFATLKETLTVKEKREIARIAQKGRKHWKSGRQMNPVLVLTRTELFGQFKIGKFSDAYGARANQGHHVFLVRDLREICDFTQQIHLGIESYYSWLDKKRKKLAAKTSRQVQASSS